MDRYLIEFEDLTSATPLGGNIDIDRYKFCILDAQNSKLKELLGDLLYNKLLDDYNETPSVLTGNYLILYNEFIKPILIHQSALEYIKIGSYQVSNGGIYKHTPANGTPVESSDIRDMVFNQKEKVEMHEIRLKRWLCRTMLPEYRCFYEQIVNPVKLSGNLDFEIF
jgi:hypothetical protein